MYIITNTFLGGEYTPSKTETYEEAHSWLKECTANNIKASFFAKIEHEMKMPAREMSVDEIINWAKANVPDFACDENYSYIEYGDGTYNIMHIYKL